jgi:hypothetical protein
MGTSLLGLSFFKVWKELIDGDTVNEYEYEYNLANFIYSMRLSFNEKNLPFLIGELC